MREILEVYRWMWSDIRGRRGGPALVRGVWFVDAVSTDLVRAGAMTLVRSARTTGLVAGRFFRGPWLSVGARGAVAVALCTLLFGPFLLLLGAMNRPYVGPLEIRVLDAPGLVEVQGQRMRPEELGRVLEDQGRRRVTVDVEWDAPVGSVEAVQAALVEASVGRLIWRLATEPPPAPTRRLR